MPNGESLDVKKKNKKKTKRTIIICFFLLIALSPLLTYSLITDSKLTISTLTLKAPSTVPKGLETNSEPKAHAYEIIEIEEVSDASSEVAGKWLGLCSKNSIKSIEDFKRTVQKDIVLANYYSGFDWKNARLGSSNEEAFAFVSHRSGDIIKKTSKPIKLPKGDEYITDGTHTVRTFCCNDIIFSPSAGPSPEKDIALEPSAGMPFAETVTFQSTPPLFPMVNAPFYIDGAIPTKNYRTINEPEPEPIPEPGTLILFVTGLVVLAVAYQKKSSNKK